MEKALQTPRSESPFKVGYSQLKSIRELDNIFDSETKIANRDALPATPAPLMNKSARLPRVEDHTAPSPKVDPDKESKYI